MCLFSEDLLIGRPAPGVPRTLGHTRERDGPARRTLQARGGNGRRMRTSSPTQRRWEGTCHRSPGDSEIPVVIVTKGRGEKRRRRRDGTRSRGCRHSSDGALGFGCGQTWLPPSFLLTERGVLAEIGPRLWASTSSLPGREYDANFSRRLVRNKERR